jgi:DNA repair exonuclease SbcCD nuclease subunit
MRIGIVGDTHLGSTDYSRKRRADFSAAFVNAINACRSHGAEIICLLGDVFDSAATGRNIDAFAEVLTEISPALVALKQSDVPLLAIPGNHEFGRGREAGELSVLESLGFVRVLRGTQFTTGDVGICGIPWQHAPADVPTHAASLLRECRAPRKIVLVHNFIQGSRSIPELIWEVDPACFRGFDKAFAGHHHIGETVGNCVIPGSTEVQNMLDESAKRVVMYDSEKQSVESIPLPRTHQVVVLTYDLGTVPVTGLVERIGHDLDRKPCTGSFVYLRIAGTLKTGQAIAKAEILGLLRERELFDYYIDLRYSTEAKTAAQSRQGASIERLLRRTLGAKSLEKARRYLAYSDSEERFTDIREEILSDH